MNYKVKNGNTKRKNTKFTIIFLAVVVFAIIVVKFATNFKALNIAYEQQKTELGDLKTKTERTIYITNRDIKAGEVISLEDTTFDVAYSSMDASLFANVIQEGTLALVDMPSGTQILNNMISDESVDSNIREEEFNVIHLSSNLVEDDNVDIRILYPNGENYIVLSKKILKNLDLSKMNCFMWLEEQETLLMSSAIVDAYLTPGTTLYTTKYVASSVQDASVTNYIPSKQIINMIKDNPNIVEVAKKELSARARTAQENRIDSFVKKNYGTDAEDAATQEDNDKFESFIYGNGTQAVAPENGESVTSDTAGTEANSENVNDTGTNTTQEEDEITYVD